jgi:DNA repair exonuclease SbcCD ATPase subunit
MSVWQRLVREAQRPPSVGLAALGTGLLAAGVVNPLFALLAAPTYAAWGIYLAGRVLRKPDLRGDAIKEIEGQLEEVARLEYGAAHPPASARQEEHSAARVRERFEALMEELDLARGSEQRQSRRVETDSAEEFEERLRQFRRIVEGEDAILDRLRDRSSPIGSLPAGLLADVSHLVNWAEAISRQRAEYVLILATHPIEETQERLEQKQRQVRRLPEAERADVVANVELLTAELERYSELQREVRSIENQLDMIESLIRNLILSTPNVPSAREQIARVTRNVETYQEVNRQVRERLQASAPPNASKEMSGRQEGG